MPKNIANIQILNYKILAMASTCSVCSKGKKTSAPTVWCPDCHDLLCQPCTEHHKCQKDTRNHSTLPYKDYQKLPPFILKIKPYCTDHKEKYTEFCRFHDTPICITCRKKHHQKCKDIPKIEDIVHKVKGSVLFEDTMLEMETKCGILKQIADDRNKYLKELNISHKKMKAGFEEKINKLIKHLTNLKDKTLSEMDTVYNKLDYDISNTVKTVQSKEEELHAIFNQKEEILEFASDYQTLIGIKEMETIVNEMDIYLNELSYGEKLLKYDLKFQVNETIEDIINGIQSLGDIQVSKSPSALSIQNTGARYLEAVEVVQTSAPVQLQLQQTIDLDGDHYYYGCCTLSSGLVVIADSGDDSDSDCKVCIHKPNGSLRSTIGKSEGVRDVTPVDDHHVAVSHHMSGTISIIDVDSDQVEKQLKVGETVAGLFCRGRELVCCVSRKGLVRVNIDSGKVEMVKKDESVRYNSNVEVSSSLICYTCPITNTVTVLDTQFNVIFKYKDEAVLRDPMGVTIDDHDNIYVTGSWSNNLVLLSPDGKSCHQLLGEDDELVFPSAVHYDSSTKKLVVVNNNGPAFIYHVR